MEKCHSEKFLIKNLLSAGAARTKPMDLKDRFFIDCNKNKKNCRVRIGSNCSGNCCLAEVTSSNNIDQDMDVAALTKKYRKKDTICPETRMARRRVISPRV